MVSNDLERISFRDQFQIEIKTRSNVHNQEGVAPFESPKLPKSISINKLQIDAGAQRKLQNIILPSSNSREKLDSVGHFQKNQLNPANTPRSQLNQYALKFKQIRPTNRSISIKQQLMVFGLGGLKSSKDIEHVVQQEKNKAKNNLKVPDSSNNAVRGGNATMKKAVSTSTLFEVPLNANNGLATTRSQLFQFSQLEKGNKMPDPPRASLHSKNSPATVGEQPIRSSRKYDPKLSPKISPVKPTVRPLFTSISNIQQSSGQGEPLNFEDIPSEIIKMEADSVYLSSSEKRRKGSPQRMIDVLPGASYLHGQIAQDIQKLEDDQGRWKPYQLSSRKLKKITLDKEQTGSDRSQHTRAISQIQKHYRKIEQKQAEGRTQHQFTGAKMSVKAEQIKKELKLQAVPKTRCVTSMADSKKQTPDLFFKPQEKRDNIVLATGRNAKRTEIKQQHQEGPEVLASFTQDFVLKKEIKPSQNLQNSQRFQPYICQKIAPITPTQQQHPHIQVKSEKFFHKTRSFANLVNHRHSLFSPSFKAQSQSQLKFADQGSQALLKGFEQNKLNADIMKRSDNYLLHLQRAQNKIQSTETLRQRQQRRNFVKTKNFDIF